MLIKQTVYFKFEEIRLTFLPEHSDDSKKRIRQLIVQHLWKLQVVRASIPRKLVMMGRGLRKCVKRFDKSSDRCAG